MKLLFVIVTLLVISSSANGQSSIPRGVITRCYTTADCSGVVNEELSQMFDSATANLNHCCYENGSPVLRSNREMISYTLNGGGCRSCNDDSVVNSVTFNCFSTCDPSSPSNNMLSGRNDQRTGTLNTCCNNIDTSTGYGTDSTTCTICYDIGDDTSPIVYDTSAVANDPHFYLPLANGDHICFSVQGEPNFAFNLINSTYIKLNAQFVLPAEDESNTIANVSTFLGDVGIVIRNKDTSNHIIIHVSAQDHSVKVNNSITVVKDKPVFVDVSNSTFAININSDSQTAKLMKDETAWLYIQTNGFGIKVRFYKKHLDLFFTKTSGLSKDTHGLIGQFFNADVNIDTDNMLMKLGDRNPILVKRDKVWPFLGIDAECWYAVDTNNQGTGLINGVYTDYIVDHLIPNEN